jgi:hypothetical protein
VPGGDCAAFTSHNRAKRVCVRTGHGQYKNSDDGKANQARQVSHMSLRRFGFLFTPKFPALIAGCQRIANWWDAAAIKSLNAFQK